MFSLENFRMVSDTVTARRRMSNRGKQKIFLTEGNEENEEEPFGVPPSGGPRVASGILPDVEVRRPRPPVSACTFPERWFQQTHLPPGWKPRLHVRQDA